MKAPSHEGEALALVTVFLLSVNHRTATTDLRGRLAVPEARLPQLLHTLHAHASEVVVLSTCNRTEVYAADLGDPTPALLAELAEYTGVPASEVGAHCVLLSGDDAVRHLMSVAGGLESVILGEPQVLGQVRVAWEIAAAAGTTGAVLNTLFRYTLQAGKDVRSHTVIARGATSIAHAAVEISRRELGTLGGRSVLVLGAGETGRVAALNLLSAGIGNLLIANRTHGRAEALAHELGGTAVPFDGLSAALAQTDTLIACAAAPEPLITAGMVRDATVGREDKPLVVMDIAVPRNVELAARDVPGVSLYDMDDIQRLCERNKHARAKAAARAGQDIHNWVERFNAWMREREAVPLVTRLRARSEQVRTAELDRALKALGGLSEREREVVDNLSRRLVNSLLHEPVVWLKEASTEEQRRWLAQSWGLPTIDQHPEQAHDEHAG